MAIDREMEEYASECVRLAESSTDPIFREKMLQMASNWAAAASGTKQEQQQQAAE
jgi:hypothetical protein